MSALARYYKARNWVVSGSDLQDSKLLKELRQEGIKVSIGHKSKNIGRDCDLAVYNQAIRENNSELKEAKKRGIPLLSYPEAVGKLTGEYKTIAVAGSHGKSTTTALVSLILINAGFDPVVIVGTKVKEFENTNFRAGNFHNPARWMVLEADEYGRAFHQYSPLAAVITNIDKEHLDTYKNLAGVRRSFLKFIENVQNGGLLVLNAADRNLKGLESEIKSIARRKKLTTYWYTRNQHLTGLSLLGFLPSLFGNHNISNMTAAYTMARALGIAEEKIYSTIKSFHGTWRRLEYRGFIKFADRSSEFAVHVYDDYAHHPTEIRASLSALIHAGSRSPISSPKRPKIICAFQPHQIERLVYLFNDFVSAFKDADVLILFPVYQVAGRERRPNYRKLRAASSKDLARAIQKKYPQKPVIYLKNPANLSESLLKLNSKFDIQNSVLVLMGAGDIVKYTDLLLKNRLLLKRRISN